MSPHPTPDSESRPWNLEAEVSDIRLVPISAAQLRALESLERAFAGLADDFYSEYGRDSDLLAGGLYRLQSTLHVIAALWREAGQDPEAVAARQTALNRTARDPTDAPSAARRALTHRLAESADRDGSGPRAPEQAVPRIQPANAQHSTDATTAVVRPVRSTAIGIMLLTVLLSIGVAIGFLIEGPWWVLWFVAAGVVLVLVAHKFATSEDGGQLGRLADWLVGGAER